MVHNEAIYNRQCFVQIVEACLADQASPLPPPLEELAGQLDPEDLDPQAVAPPAPQFTWSELSQVFKRC